MKIILKYAGICFSVIIIVTVVVLYFVNGESTMKQEQKAQKQNQQDQTSDQYKMYFNFDGDKTQIIDLIKGNAEFNVVYSGNSKFTAKILNADGTLLATLADVDGSYNQRREIDVPETGPYLLDVTTSGEWSLARK